MRFLVQYTPLVVLVRISPKHAAASSADSKSKRDLICQSCSLRSGMRSTIPQYTVSDEGPSDRHRLTAPASESHTAFPTPPEIKVTARPSLLRAIVARAILIAKATQPKMAASMREAKVA